MTGSIKKVITSMFIGTMMLIIGIGIFAATPAVANATETAVTSEEETIIAEGNASYSDWDSATGTYIYPVKWKLDNEGTLTIYGEGAMRDYYWYWDEQYSNAPWALYGDQIVEIVIEEGVTVISSYAFAGLINVTGELVLPDSIQRIREYAFAGCSGLSGDLIIPANVTYIGSNAFGKKGVKLNEWEDYTYFTCSGLNGILKFTGSVPKISSGAFAGTNFTAIELPDNWTEIPAYTFDGMKNIKSIDLPSNLTSIKKYAFRGCESLESIDIPQTVVEIGMGAFKNCSVLSDVEIPANVMFIDDYAFQNCYALASVEIPGTVERIGGSAFAKCTSLTTVKLNEGITNIGNYAFSKCAALTEIDLPDSLNRIGNYAFRQCTGLEKLSLGGNIRYIGYNAFYNCKNVSGKLKFPDTLEYVGDRAFYNCIKLEEIKLQGNDAIIDWCAFEDCTGLKTIEIEEGVASLGYSCFNNCDNLSGKIVLPESLASMGTYVFAYCDNITEIVFPDTMSTISAGTCSGCSNLKSIDFGENVTKISGSAFDYCYNLSGELNLPDTLEYIGNYAFAGCRGFTGDLIIPENVTYIGTGAFTTYNTYYDDGTSTEPNGVQITTFDGKLQLPEGLETIGGNAFAGTGFTKYNMPDSVTSIGYGIFSGCKNITEVKVPLNMTKIPNGMFSRCYGIKKVDIPKNITIIGNGAFESCYELESVTIHNGVTKIGSNAFRYCSGLDNLIVPANVESLGSNFVSGYTLIKCYKGSAAEIYAVERGHSYVLIDGTDEENIISGAKGETLTWTINKGTGVLTVNTTGGEMQTFINRTAPWEEYSGYIKKVVITGNPENIGARAFRNLTKLSEVTIPSSVKSIDKQAFKYCENLKTITIPSSVETIGYEAFYESGLETIELAEGLKEIGFQAFMCSNLKAVDLPDTVEKLGNNAFRGCFMTEFTIPALVTSLEYNKNENNQGDFNGLISKNYGLQKLVIKNRYCEIPEAFSLHNKDNLVIHGWKNSTAEKFAKNNGLQFQALDGIIHIHSWGEPFIAKEASCGEQGIERKLCTECGEFKDKEVAGGNHKEVVDNAYAPTCTATGRTEGSHCATCGAIIKEQEMIPAKGHKKSVVKERVEATCTTDGMTESAVCAVCDELLLEAEIIPAKGHDYKATVTKPACREGGYTTHECTRCGNSYVDNKQPAKGHTIVTDEAVAATCTESGLTEGSHCSDCDNVIKAQTRIKATGHKYSKWTITEKPTCTKDGAKSRTCANCGSVDEDIILATDHNVKEVITRATTEDDGQILEVCRKCGDTLSSNTIAAIKTVNLKNDTYVYNNKANKPKVTIKDTKGKALINGTDYTLTYTAGKNVGKHSVTVKFKGEYSGKKVIDFVVNPKATTLKKPVAGKKQITVKWNKQAVQTTGYEIQYSTKKNMNGAKTVTVAKAGTTSKVIKGLKAKTKYFVQIRTYKTVNGVKYYSAWSAKKNIKTK